MGRGVREKGGNFYPSNKDMRLFNVSVSFLFFLPVTFLSQPGAIKSLVDQIIKSLSTNWETQVWSLGEKVPWRRKWQPTAVFLPGKPHGQSMGSQESDMTYWLNNKRTLKQNHWVLFNVFACLVWGDSDFLFFFTGLKKAHQNRWKTQC